MTNWTDDQLSAITERNKDLLISAGAGSGKTAVLTERIIRLITEDKIDADQFLVLTFTKAAASEMRQRIRKALNAKIRDAQTDRDFLYKQMNLLEKAQISTIHSFCLNVIKKYYYVIDIDPAGGLLSDAESMLLKQEALEQLFEEKYTQSDEDFIALADMYSPGNDDERFKSIILAAYTFIMNRPDPWEWLSEACEKFNTDGTSFENHPAAVFLKEYFSETVEQCLHMIGAAQNLCRIYDNDGKRTQQIMRLEEDVLLLRARLSEGLRFFLDALHSFSFLRYDIRSQCDKSDEIKALRNGVKERIDALKESFGFSYETYLSQMQKLYLPMKKTGESIKDFSLRYAALKKEKASMDYNDLEHGCLAILKDAQAAGQIKMQYELVFVDEYQDTNSIQEAIITKVVKDNALFTVGDIKQSIYRFREAEPDLFMRRYRSYQHSGDEHKKLIFLNTNFRTAPSIIGGINEIFSKIMFSETGGVDYHPDERMIAGKSEDGVNKTEIHIVNYGESNNSTNQIFTDNEYVQEEMSDFKKQEAEAAYVAQLIKQLLTQDIYDESAGVCRKIVPSDIAVLGRSMRVSSEYFIEALKTAGITAEYEKSGSYYDEMEVALLINLLKIVDNAKNDLPLVSVMRSFLFGFNADEMLAMRLFSKDMFYYHEAVNRYAREGDNEALRNKVNEMLGKITEFRELSKHVSIEKLLRKIYNETGAVTFMAALPKGRQRQENLKYLLKLASHYENTSFKGLYNFILYVEKCKAHDSSFKINDPSKSEQTVKLMTVHKSKGLEFNVVIVTGCGNSFNLADIKEDMIFDKDLGICPTFYDLEHSYYCDTLLKTAAKKRIGNENTAEEMRILYVAATRAKQRLLFVGALKPAQADQLLRPDPLPVSAALIKQSSNYLSWILKAALAEEELDALKSNNYTSNDHFSVTMGWATPAGSHIAEDPIAAKNLLDSIIHKSENYIKTAEILSYVYPHRSAGKLPSKLSVSALKDPQQLAVGEKVIALQGAPKFMGSASFTKAQIGTLVHTVLMHLDLKVLHKSDLKVMIAKQMENMVIREILSEREKAVVDIDLISDFLSSDIGSLLFRTDRIYKEQPFIIKMKAGELSSDWDGIDEMILVQGIIDCFFEIDEKLILIDYKTDHVQDEKRLHQLVEMYTRQIELYNRALKEIRGREADEKYICFLTHKTNIRIS